MTRYAVYGADGFGREVLPMVRNALGANIDIVFVDDSPQKIGTPLNGVPVLGFNEANAQDRTFFLAIADSNVRRRVAERIAVAKGVCKSICASTALLFDDVVIGEGAIVCDHVTVTSNVRIGSHFHANIYSYIAHDCKIGNFVTFAPRVSCNGRVEIGDGAYIGTGAVLRQGSHDRPLTIGAGAIVGMGAIVTKDVAPGVTVVGNPAKPLVKSV